ncbi:MAG: sigma-70 family RNA polymerase sigma factor [Chloroflexota bacterium]|nr:sigma-70 family RNA polymerase sigma factor [Chloroflexota bacterium]
MDAHQFAARYREYLPRVLNFIRLRVPDDSLAQDLTATTFEQAFRKIDQLRNPEAFGGWVFRIARNEVGQYYRRRRDQVSLDALLELPARGETPHQTAARREDLSEVLAAIDTLSLREQEIVALKFAGGLSNREIAQAMDLSDSNVGVILFRSIRKVRDRLGIEG